MALDPNHPSVEDAMKALEPFQELMPSFDPKHFTRPPIKFIALTVAAVNKKTKFGEGFFTNDQLQGNMATKEEKLEFFKMLKLYTEYVNKKHFAVVPENIAKGAEVEKTLELISAMGRGALDPKMPFDKAAKGAQSKLEKEKAGGDNASSPDPTPAEQKKKAEDPKTKGDDPKKKPNEPKPEPAPEPKKKPDEPKKKPDEPKPEPAPEPKKKPDEPKKKPDEPKPEPAPEPKKKPDEPKKKPDEPKPEPAPEPKKKKEEPKPEPIPESKNKPDETKSQAPIETKKKIPDAPAPKKPKGEEVIEDDTQNGTRLNARKAPPKAKEEVSTVIEAQVPEIIKEADEIDDADDVFIEETVGGVSVGQSDENGKLMKSILEACKQVAPGDNGQAIQDADRFKQSIDLAKGLLQHLARSAQPLDTLIQFSQEDLGNMENEYRRWSEECNKQQKLLETEKSNTEQQLHELSSKLEEIEKDITRQQTKLRMIKAEAIFKENDLLKAFRAMCSN